MTELSDKCEVPCLNNWGSATADPVIETELLNTSLGVVVAQTIGYRLGMPKTKYGILVKELKPKIEEGAEDYSKPFKPKTNFPGVVYVVQKATTEEQKRKLAGVLRNECQKYEKIDFF